MKYNKKLTKLIKDIKLAKKSVVKQTLSSVISFKETLPWRKTIWDD